MILYYRTRSQPQDFLATTVLLFLALVFKPHYLIHGAEAPTSTTAPGTPTPIPVDDGVLPGTDASLLWDTTASFARDGDFYLGGLFDIHLEQGGVCQEISPRGLQWMYAMVYAIELINARTDLLPNITLGFHIKDTCGNPNVAVTSSLDFITSSATLGACENNSTPGSPDESLGQLVAVVGPATSNAAVSVASLFELFKIPEIGYSATSQLLSETRYSYFTRVVPSDNQQSEALADIVSHFGWTVVATVSTDDLAYGLSGQGLFLKHAKAKNICVAYENKIGSRSTKEELLQIVSDLRTFPNVKVIVAFANESPMLRLLQVFAEQNATGYTWIGSDAWTASPALTGDERIAKVTQGMLGLRYSTREVADFDAYLRSLSPSLVGYQDPFLIEYWERKLACYIFEVSQESREKCSRNEILPASDTLFAGQFVSTILDAVEVVAMALHVALDCDEKQCKSKSRSIDGEEILTLMKNVSFIGRSGYRITFTEGGDMGSSATYDVYNLKPVRPCSGETSIEMIGMWNRMGGFTIRDNIAWQSNGTCSPGAIPVSFCSAPCRPGQRRIRKGYSECCWECVDCLDNHYSNHEDARTCSNCSYEEVVNANRTGCDRLPALYLTPNSPLGIVIMMLSIPGIFMSVTFGAIFRRRRHTQVVIRSCAGQSYAILFCAFACFVFSFLPLFPASNGFCIVKACLQLLPVALLQGMLLLTAYVTKKGRRFVKDRTRVLVVFGVLVAYCVFAGVWFAVDLPKPSRIPDTVAKVVYVDCVDGKIFAIALSFVYSVLLDAVGLCMAYRARRKEDNFKEGKFIFFAFVVHIMIWVATLGIYFAIGGGKHFQAFILAIGVIFTAYVPLILLFVPKLYLMRTKPYANEKMTARAKGKIKGKPRTRRKCRDTRLSAKVLTARLALLGNCHKALESLRGERKQNIGTVQTCSARIEELTSRHQRKLDEKKSLLWDLRRRVTHLIVSSPHLPSTSL